MSKVIAAANQKGGVGKTTTAVNLSAALGKRGKNVLLIDLDPQGNATSGLGIDRKDVGKNMYNVLIGGEKLEDIIIKTDFTNLSIAPSSIELSGAEIELVGVGRREFVFKDALEGVRENFDYIIVDCPPSLGLLTVNALCAADTVLVPIQCEYYALEGVSLLTNTIKKVKKALNPALDFEGILLTMFDARTNLSIQVVDEVKKYFPQKVYRTIIPRNVRLSEAPGFGKPVIEYDPTSKGAEMYMELADEVIMRNEGEW
ncbi:MAG: ParA family protein [Clostridiaceae bacterium]|nr:ParA family protein [Clostridiaceae bacterium]